MKKERIELLAQEVWNETWSLLDNEPDINTVQMGEIANATEKAFKEVLSMVAA